MYSCCNIWCGIIGDSDCDLVSRTEERSARVQVWVSDVHFAVPQHDLPLCKDEGARPSKVVGLLVSSHIRGDGPCAGGGHSASTHGKVGRFAACCQVFVDDLLREALFHPSSDRTQRRCGSRITNALHLKLDRWLSPGLVLCPCSPGAICFCGNDAHQAFAQALRRLPGVGFLGFSYSCSWSRGKSKLSRRAGLAFSSSDDNELNA